MNAKIQQKEVEEEKMSFGWSGDVDEHERGKNIWVKEGCRRQSTYLYTIVTSVYIVTKKEEICWS